MSAYLDTSFFGIHEEISLTRNGAWLSNGEEITHPGTIIGFSRNIFRNKNGYEIRLGLGNQQERKQIHIEDTIYFVTSIDGNPNDGFTVTLNDLRKVYLDPTTLRYRPGRLTCGVPHPNEGTTEEAKFLSTAYYSLLNHAQASGDGFVLIIQNKKIYFGQE